MFLDVFANNIVVAVGVFVGRTLVQNVGYERTVNRAAVLVDYDACMQSILYMYHTFISSHSA